jgi:ribonuclease P protein component
VSRVSRARRTVIERLVRSEDFERVLRTRSRAQTEHFAVHHVPDRPSAPSRRAARPVAAKLSTSDQQSCAMPVDDSLAPPAAPDGLWLGAVVPKRHARRAVTRTLLKRQIRCAVTRCASGMPGGLWVVRLRAPFERTMFTSAASEPLRRAARAELDHLLCRVAPRTGRLQA